MKLKDLENVLPQKIVEEIKSVFKEFKMTETQKKKAINLILKAYKNSCYEPGEAVGVVAAQSISEPATQMSCDGNEKIIIKHNDRIKIVKIGEFVDNVIDNLWFEKVNDSEVCDLPDNVNYFVLSLDQDEKVKWKRIKSCIRHKSPEKLLKIITKSGRQIIATDHHSFIIRKNNKIIPIAGKKLKIRERIPVIKFLPENCINSIDISTIHLPKHNVNSSILELNKTSGWFIGAYLSGSNCRISQADNKSYQKDFEHFISNSLLFKFLITEYVNNSERKVPEFAFSANEKFVSGLLRGYFDSSGSVCVEKKMIRLNSNSEDIIDGIKLLLTRFGIFAHKRKNKKRFYLLIPYKYAPIFLSKIGSNIKDKNRKLKKLAKLSKKFWEGKSQDFADVINNFGNIFYKIARKLKYPTRYINNFTKNQKIGRMTLYRYIKIFEKLSEERKVNIRKEIEILKRMFNSDVVWDEIIKISYVKPSSKYVYDVSVDGLETFTTFDGIVTHNTMRTYHLAGASEIKVTLGLPRLIEIFDARRTPKTPMMTIYLKKKYNTMKKAYKIASEIQETLLKDVTKEPAVDILNMRIEIPLDFEELKERKIKVNNIVEILKDSYKDLKIKLTKEKIFIKPVEEITIKQLQKLKAKVLKTRIKGIKGIIEVRVLKKNNEWVINTLGSNLIKVLNIPGIDARRVTSNNIHEVYKAFGIEAARQAIIDYAMDTMKEGGLDVDIRHIMLVADVMTADGKIKAIGRYGVAGSKGSVLARANFEETIKHLTRAAINAEVDTLDSIIENVIINQVVPVGTGMFKLFFKPKK